MTVEVRLAGGISGIRAAWVKRVIGEALRYEKAKRMAVSVLLTNNKEIRELNRRFLRHDYATDVISFGLSYEMGDVVVSVEMARAVSKELGISFKEELARYLVHGTLHLLGYEDERKKDKMLMDRRQEQILRNFYGKKDILRKSE